MAHANRRNRLPQWAKTRIWNEDDDIDPVAPILARFPGPVVIPDSKRARVAICAVVTLVIAPIVGVILGSLDWTAAWNSPQTVSLGSALLVCVAVELVFVGLVFMDFGSFTLDAEGFEVQSPWQSPWPSPWPNPWMSLRRAWKDVDGFEEEWFSRMGLVSYLNTRPASDTVRDFQWVLGNRELLGSTYGFGRRDFARLLAQWRERALVSSH